MDREVRREGDRLLDNHRCGGLRAVIEAFCALCGQNKNVDLRLSLLFMYDEAMAVR